MLRVSLRCRTLVAMLRLASGYLVLTIGLISGTTSCSSPDGSEGGDDLGEVGDEEEELGDIDCSALGPSDGDIVLGSVIPDFTLTDQTGASVSLHEHCESRVLLYSTAGW